MQRLIQLRHWGASLGLRDERTTYSVLEAPDPGEALTDYARHNHVDHIVVGARATSALRRYLGSVSSQVVAGAPCSVTVVRTPRQARSARRIGEPVADDLSPPSVLPAALSRPKAADSP
jgi:K+-sensing histidine kinase KdpD